MAGSQQKYTSRFTAKPAGCKRSPSKETVWQLGFRQHLIAGISYGWIRSNLTTDRQNRAFSSFFNRSALFFLLLTLGVLVWGCSPKPVLIHVQGHKQPLPTDTILETAGGRTLSFEQLADKLAQVQVIYVGERHTDAAHHAFQLKVIKALTEKGTLKQVGMEMFARTYQAKLDRWSAGQWDWPTFLRETHWYANWKFNDKRYRNILEFIQFHRLKLIGLNIPFCLPPKIAVGGLSSLSAAERALLPKEIDTTNPAHRNFLHGIYDMHHLRGRDNFEYFYEAQCAWEDGMAEAVADHVGSGQMVVLAGNGHIVQKFGIPDRAFRRKNAPFLTVLLTSPGEETTTQDADFIWIGPAPKGAHPKNITMK